MTKSPLPITPVLSSGGPSFGTKGQPYVRQIVQVNRQGTKKKRKTVDRMRTYWQAATAHRASQYSIQEAGTTRAAATGIHGREEASHFPVKAQMPQSRSLYKGLKRAAAGSSHFASSRLYHFCFFLKRERELLGHLLEWNDSAGETGQSQISHGHQLTNMCKKNPSLPFFLGLSIFSEPPLEGNASFYTKNKDNPFADACPDPLCKLNLKETSDFVRSFPMARNSSASGTAFLQSSSAQRRRESGNGIAQRKLEAPSTPGRPVFSFSVGNLSKKNVPSKWDDAEKWLISSSSSCHDSPAHLTKPQEPSKTTLRQHEALKPRADFFSEKGRVADEKASTFTNKFTDNIEPIFPNFRYSEPTKESFLFGNSVCQTMKDVATEVAEEVRCRDIGTEMTPLGSSTTSRCHTPPFKNSSPARHNTPADRSGPLGVNPSTTFHISELQDCHFAKLQLRSQFDSVVSNWSSREEEEEEISKSLRHFEMGGCRKSVSESRASVWEDEEKTKSCIRYQREEAKIQAWVNLQTAKAEAQARKLEQGRLINGGEYDMRPDKTPETTFLGLEQLSLGRENRENEVESGGEADEENGHRSPKSRGMESICRATPAEGRPNSPKYQKPGAHYKIYMRLFPVQSLFSAIHFVIWTQSINRWKDWIRHMGRARHAPARG
ncbi:hypothetical protein ACLOJK_000991 [Asimina triloba]